MTGCPFVMPVVGRGSSTQRMNGLAGAMTWTLDALPCSKVRAAEHEVTSTWNIWRHCTANPRIIFSLSLALDTMHRECSVLKSGWESSLIFLIPRKLSVQIWLCSDLCPWLIHCCRKVVLVWNHCGFFVIVLILPKVWKNNKVLELSVHMLNLLSVLWAWRTQILPQQAYDLRD